MSDFATLLQIIDKGSTTADFATLLQIIDKGSTIAVLLYLLWTDRRRAEVAENYIREQPSNNHEPRAVKFHQNADERSGTSQEAF